MDKKEYVKKQRQYRNHPPQGHFDSGQSVSSQKGAS